jgi:hypothetical protein
MIYILEITKKLRIKDVYIESDNLLSLQMDALSDSPLLDNGDGYRIIQYTKYNGLDDFVLPGEPNEAIVLRHSGSDGLIVEDSYSTAVEVRSAIDALNTSDGYLAYATWDNDNGAKRLEQRPSLWRVGGDDLDGGAINFGRELSKRINEHGRVDTDRF